MILLTEMASPWSGAITPGFHWEFQDLNHFIANSLLIDEFDMISILWVNN